MEHRYDIEYELLKVSPMEYKILKTKFGFDVGEYTISNTNNSKWRCNCMSGRTRGYCKHNDWVRWLRDGHAVMLPGDVKLHETIDINQAKRGMYKAMEQYANKKIGAKNEKVKKVSC